MATLIRDALTSILPPWLVARMQNGKTSGYRVVWALVAPLDKALDAAAKGIAAMLGRGTPTALPYIGRSRGIMRGQADTDQSYQDRIRSWLTTWEGAGSSATLALQIHSFLSSAPAVDVIVRGGMRVRCSTTGVITKDTVAWDWDSTSNPERSGFWSEMFVIVYSTQWTATPPWGATRVWGSGVGLGCTNTASEYDAVSSLISTWKSAHSYVRCLIVNRNGTLPVPNGNWGMWHNRATGTPSSRDLVNNFYWDFDV